MNVPGVVVEHDLEVPTADGTADAKFHHWTDGPRPGVLFLPDGLGVRPSQRQMALRVAEAGYSVLLPNIYYRTAREPFFLTRPDFGNEKDKARFGALTGPLSPDAMERDGSAYVDFLAARPEVSDAPIGVVGFCFTGAFAMRVAATRSDRISAAASFHGGGLFKEDPSSPHLVLPRIKARLFFGHARDDRGMPAAAIAKFEAALAEWGGNYESETFDALHGWTVPDSAVFDPSEAERAFGKLRDLFAAELR